MHGFGFGFGIFSLISMLLPLVIIGGIVYIVLNLSKGNHKGYVKGNNDDPLTILKRRYAHGEIDQDEYIQRTVDLENGYTKKF